MRVGALSKIFRGAKNGEFYGASGGLSDVALFERSIMLGESFGELCDSIQAIWISPKGVALASGRRPCFAYIEAPYYAIGAGSHLALGAMWKGATAEEAVECAIALETGCGGAIDVIRIYEQANQFRPDPAVQSPYEGLHPTHFGGPR